MISARTGVRIVVATAAIDGRKGMDSLAAVVQQSQAELRAGQGNEILALRHEMRRHPCHGDGTGLWLHQKRLEARNFAWPTVKDGTIVLTAAQLAMLLEGLDWWRVAPMKTKTPSIAC